MNLGIRVRALRQRLHLKQTALAQLLGVSQTYISRLEAGTVAASPDIAESLLRLTRDPATRSPFDDIVALTEHSPFACFLVRPCPAEHRYPLQAASPSIRDAYAGNAEDLAAAPALAALCAQVDAIWNAGLREGRVLSARGPWQPKPDAPDELEVRYIPVRDGAGGHYLHASVTHGSGLDGLVVEPFDRDAA